MKNILLVCSGNTCRSAMAEAILEDAVDRSSELDGKIRVDSAGTFAFEDTEATPYAIEVMEERGLNIEKHRAKQIDKELVEWADIILVMENTHIEQIEAMFPDAGSKMSTLLGFADGKDGFASEVGYDLLDPYGDDKEEYEDCAEQIAVAIDKVVARLEAELCE